MKTLFSLALVLMLGGAFAPNAPGQYNEPQQEFCPINPLPDIPYGGTYVDPSWFYDGPSFRAPELGEPWMQAPNNDWEDFERSYERWYEPHPPDSETFPVVDPGWIEVPEWGIPSALGAEDPAYEPTDEPSWDPYGSDVDPAWGYDDSDYDSYGGSWDYGSDASGYGNESDGWDYGYDDGSDGSGGWDSGFDDPGYSDDAGGWDSGSDAGWDSGDTDTGGWGAGGSDDIGGSDDVGGSDDGGWDDGGMDE
jgi:hypothetical protein